MYQRTRVVVPAKFSFRFALVTLICIASSSSFSRSGRNIYVNAYLYYEHKGLPKITQKQVRTVMNVYKHSQFMSSYKKPSWR